MAKKVDIEASAEAEKIKAQVAKDAEYKAKYKVVAKVEKY